MTGTRQATNRITGQRRWIALAAVMVTMFFSALDQTVIGTAMPTIVGDLKGLDLMAWLFTAYMITSALTVPVYGKLSDMYGRKPFYVFGLGLFIAGSALAGLSRSMGFLIAARALQGLGGGAMMSMPRATIGDIFNPKERGKWMGLMMSVWGLASIAGPFVGGSITDAIGWRWCFYINLPIGAVALAAIAYALPDVRTGVGRRVDWKGSLLLMLALIPVLLAFSWAGTRYAWGSPLIVAMLAMGAACTAGFILVERTAAEPVLAPRLFRNPVFNVSVGMGLMMSMSMFGGLMFLPVFIQGVVGLSARDSGALMTPMMLSLVAGSTAGGLAVSRTGRYKAQAVLGALVMLAAAVILSRVDESIGWRGVAGIMIVMGLGLGISMPLVNVAVQNAFPYAEMGVVNSTQQFVQSLGGIIVAPIYGTILSGTFNARMGDGLPPGLAVSIAAAPKAFQDLLSNPQALVVMKTRALLKERFASLGPAGARLYDQFLDAVKHALTAAVVRVFTIGIIFAAVGLLLAFLLREVPLRKNDYYEDDAGLPPDDPVT